MARYQTYRNLLAAALFVASSSLCKAEEQSAVDKLSQCLVMSTTGADRVVLVRWMSFGFAAHSSLRGDFSVSAEKIEDADKKMAALFSDLFVNRCKAEAQSVISAGQKDEGFKIAFQALGAVSAREIYGDSQVNARMSNFTKFIDEKRIEDALK